MEKNKEQQENENYIDSFGVTKNEFNIRLNELNKELTPMQELIEWVSQNPNINISNKARIVNKAKSLLPKEETMIVCSWIDGKENREFGDNVFDDAQDYYNTKYNNQIK